MFKSRCPNFRKTQRANLSLLVLACSVSSIVTIAELAKNFLINERVVKDSERGRHVEKVLKNGDKEDIN